MGEFLIWDKKRITDKQIAELNEELNNCPEYHPIEQHNFYIQRGYPCPYCELGSKPVPKAMILENLE